MQGLPVLELKRPSTLAEATQLLSSLPDARVLAGGTDLLPNLRRGIERPSALVDLGGIPELDGIRGDAGRLSIGAGVTLSALASNALLGRDYAAISQAAASIAGRGHRNAATLGGNLCLDTRCVYYNQSAWWRTANDYCLKRGGTVCHVAPQGDHCHAAFCGDLAPALIALDAEVELVASGGSRTVALGDLYREDGAAHLAMRGDELLARANLPAIARGARSAYRKARIRQATDFPLAGVACALTVADGVLTRLRVGLTGTNSRPFLLAGTDAFLGKPVDARMTVALGKLIQKQTSPMRTTVSQSNYRRQVAVVLAQRIVRELTADDSAPADAVQSR